MCNGPNWLIKSQTSNSDSPHKAELPQLNHTQFNYLRNFDCAISFMNRISHAKKLSVEKFLLAVIQLLHPINFTKRPSQPKKSGVFLAGQYAAGPNHMSLARCHGFSDWLGSYTTRGRIFFSPFLLKHGIGRGIITFCDSWGIVQYTILLCRALGQWNG